MRGAAALLLSILQASAAFAACNWNTSPRNINFGTYSVFNATPLTATSNFRFRCTPGTTATLMLSMGSSSTYNPRTMLRTTAPVVAMDYNLFMDPANTIIWGNGTQGTQYLTFGATGGNQTFRGTIYGTVPAGLDVSPGNYRDIVRARLSWPGGMRIRNFTVNARVLAGCIASTTPLSFGTYDPVVVNATVPKNATGAIDVFCTAGTLATVSLDFGSHAAGTVRRMLGSSGDLLQYDVYRDSARTIEWNATNTDSGTSASRNTPINGGFMAYGRIPQAQDVGIGNYNDTLLVTVNY